MNKIDIILIYLIIIISFVCIVKIYLNNKKIERFNTFEREFSGVMKFVDKDNVDNYLGCYPGIYGDCFTNDTCDIDGTKYIYENDKIKKDDGDGIADEIDVTTIKLPKGEQGENGMDALKPNIKFYYKNGNDNINEDEDGNITIVPDASHESFQESEGDYCNDGTSCPEDIKVYVTRHDNCTPLTCDKCEGEASIDIITSSNGDDAVTVNGNITTGNIILQEDGKICVDEDDIEKCLNYSDIKKLLEWRDYIEDDVVT